MNVLLNYKKHSKSGEGRLLIKTFAEKTAADDKSIGFDYQYYYFLYTVLGLKKCESAGLEVLDDVHTELSCDRQVLIQLKHTVQVNAEGEPLSITQYDSSLWKTLSNWANVITDPASNRGSETAQKSFIEKTDFLLVTNKSASSKCDFFKVLEDPTIAIETLKRLESGTTDLNIIGYINKLLGLNESILLAFIEKIKIENDVNDIIKLCHIRLEEKQLPIEKLADVFRDLDSAIRQDNFIVIKNKQKVVISFEDFTQKYRKYFDIARTHALVLRSLYSPLPDNLENQTFIKQLIDIGDLNIGNTADIAEVTKFKLFVDANLNKWLSEGHLTNEELRVFKENIILKWKNSFKAKHRESTPESCNKNALSLLDELRADILSIDGQLMDIHFSNGQYYLLSDIPDIGWHIDWERLYK